MKNQNETALLRANFIIELVNFLVDNSAGKSIALQMEQNARPLIPWAQMWARLRSASLVQGWADRVEAIDTLCDLLGFSSDKIKRTIQEIEQRHARLKNAETK